MGWAAELFGPTLMAPASAGSPAGAAASGRVQVKTEERLAGAKTVGLFFNAAWCSACSTFTPILAEAYRARKNPSFEVVAIPFDGELTMFTGHTSSFPFPSIVFEESGSRRRKLRERYAVNNLPRLIIIDTESGFVVNDMGEQQLMLTRTMDGLESRASFPPQELQKAWGVVCSNAMAQMAKLPAGMPAYINSLMAAEGLAQMPALDSPELRAHVAELEAAGGGGGGK